MPFSETCPLCGALIPEGKTCRDMYHELSLYTLARSHADHSFIHQYIVDAYGVQHISKNTKPVAIAAGLIGLYLFAERGYTGKQVQNAHVALGNKMKEWPVLALPKAHALFTVMDVLDAPAGAERDEAIRAWARAVWEIWRDEHVKIRQLVAGSNLI